MRSRQSAPLNFSRTASTLSVAKAMMVIAVSFVLSNIALEFCDIDGPERDHWEDAKSRDIRTMVANDINLVILGNSKVFRNINTTLLNSKLNESNCSLTAYNAAIPTMSEVEFVKYLDSISANQNISPTYIMFAPFLFRSTNNMETERRKSNVTMRYAQVHYLSLSASKAHLPQYFSLAQDLIEQSVNKSKLSSLLLERDAHRLELNEPSNRFRLSEINFGYLSLERDPVVGESSPRRTRFISDPNIWEKKQKKLMAIQRKIKLNEHQDLGELQNNRAQIRLLNLYINKIRQMGASPLLIFPPDLSAHRYRHFYQQKFPEIPQINVDEHLHSFIAKDMWFDKGHLSEKGASRFSTLIAQELCSKIPQS